MQVVGMTTHSNRHPVRNYRTDSRHEEGNYYSSHGHGYRIFDDVAYRLGVNDGWLLRYGLSAADETIRRYQPHYHSLANMNERPVKEENIPPNSIRFFFNPLNGFMIRFR